MALILKASRKNTWYWDGTAWVHEREKAVALTNKLAKKLVADFQEKMPEFRYETESV